MKLLPSAVSLLCLLLLSSSCHADQVILNDGPVCNRTVLSCHWNGGNVDACCSPKYGLVVLSLQWVENLGPSDDFTIHGLWPDTCNGGRAPSRGCDRSRISNQVGNIIRSRSPSLYQELSRIWPSYKGDNNWFWSHEWTKHGSCVSTLQPRCYGDSYVKYQDVIDYFNKTLDLHAEYDLYGALNLAGVSPGRRYQVQTMGDALRNAFGKKVKIDCDRSGTLSEISLFFYVQGRDQYVLTDAVHPGTCRQSVWYPTK
ncbi:ribonuclease T2 [Hesseltinella vesiculosa]|uniref:ribonuclease T2 n=1 Tax=Hesseltinella vesiculosa TaxID=101127 RepID=A0A1X2GCQ3_9FUNG|nr:ribonuclease T2 [Hesseltinella vesiculosa]